MMNPASIDHIGIAGRKLSGLEESFRRIGFNVAPRCELVSVDPEGRAVPLGQVNSHVVFGHSYIELTAVEGDLKGHHLEQALSRYSGLHIIVLATPDALQTRTRLVDQGVAVTDLAQAGRTVRYPGATGDARFNWFALPEIQEAFACYVEQLTRELVFDPALTDHPNGARELSGVLACCENPEEAAQAMARMTGASVETDGPDSAMLRLPLGTIRYVTPDRLATEYPGVKPPVLPWLAGLSVSITDPAATMRFLSDAGVQYQARGSGAWIDPGQCGGTIVEFVSD